MSRPQDRRGFLRGLASLPLVGGSVALIGSPTAAAVQPSAGMVATYVAWLDAERRLAAHVSGFGGMVPALNPGAEYHAWSDCHLAGRAAITRAPIVLAAVGCPLTSAEAEEAWRQPLESAPMALPLAVNERERLLTEYETWLWCEQSRVARELRPPSGDLYRRLVGPAHEWHARRPETSDTAERAAVLLATVRCNWRGPAR